MEKIKKILSPGSTQDDEVMYGDEQTRRASVAAGKQPEQDTATLHPTEGLEEKEKGGVLRQILNPDNAKHDELRYGTTATTDEPQRPGPNQLQTDEGPKDHTVLGQILNPGGKKYDEQRHGSTAATEGDRRSSIPIAESSVADPNTKFETDPDKKDRSILKQIINPRRENYDEAAHSGKTAHEAGDSSNSQQAPVRDNSVTRQVLNPDNNKYDPVGHETSQADYATARSSNTGQNAAFAGGAAAVGGGAAYATTKDKNESSQPLQDKSAKPAALETQTRETTTTRTADNKASSTLDAKPQTDGLADDRSATQAAEESSGSHNYGRDIAIAGGAGALGAGGASAAARGRERELEKGDTIIAATGTAFVQKPFQEQEGGLQSSDSIPERSASSNLPGEASNLESSRAQINPVGGTQQPSSTGAHINPIGAPEELAPIDHRYNRDGASTGIQNTGSAPDQINPAHIKDVEAATYTYSSQPVGFTSEDISRPYVAPHIPGEFPLKSGQDPHETSKNYGSTAGGSQLAPMAGSSWAQDVAARAIGNDVVHGTAPQQTGNDTREVKPEGHGKATAAGVGGAGLATAGAATAYGASKSSEPTSTAASTHPGGEGYPVQSASQQPAPSSIQHQGSDAAIAGGALGLGAVGAGTAFEATKMQHGDAAVSRPQDTNVDNKTSTSSQPTTTTTTNTTMQSYAQPATQQPTPSKDDSHHGRDAAIVGGAGAAGTGAAYAATRDRDQAQDTSQVITPQQNTINHPLVTSAEQPTSALPSNKQTTTHDTTTTAGPHTSDLANKADPHVESDPAKQAAQKASKDHDYQTRDAALASGAVGTGAGAAAYDTTHEAYGTDDLNKHNKLHKPSPDEKKAEKEAEKEHKKAEKEAEKEHKKAEKQAEKDQKKAEKETEKKDKPSLIDRILHPGRHSEDKEGHQSVDDTTRGRDTQPAAATGYTTTQESAGGVAGQEGRVIEPHTGLPMNLEKYGTGAGGTDGAKQIEGYHEQDPALRAASIGTGEGAGTKAGHAQPGEAGVAGPDWDAIGKKNTPY